jgi:Uma2 family endonuclease
MEAIKPLSETKLITGEELLELGDIGRSELIDGKVVTMSPADSEHGFIGFNLGAELRTFVRQKKLGWVIGGETGIYIRRNPDRIRGADIVFVSKEKLPNLPIGFLDVAPELVIGIISPSDRWQDVRDKLADYFSIGIGQVWVVEPANRTVLVYRSLTDIQEFGEEDTLSGEGMLEGFKLVVAELFAE